LLPEVEAWRDHKVGSARSARHSCSPVGSLRAGVRVFGRDTNERVFAQPGFYRLRVGSDMETDSPRYAECVVRLRP